MAQTIPAASTQTDFAKLMKRLGAKPLTPLPRKQKSALAPFDGQYLVIMELDAKNVAQVMTATQPGAVNVALNGKQATIIRRAWTAPKDGAAKGTPLAVKVVKENKEYKLTEPGDL